MDKERKMQKERSKSRGAHIMGQRIVAKFCLNFCAGGSQVVNFKLRWTPEDTGYPLQWGVFAVLSCSIMLDSLPLHRL